MASMKHFLLSMVAVFFFSLSFAQRSETGEAAIFGIKNQDGTYTLIRMSLPDQKPIIYTLKPNQQLQRLKKYEDEKLFQNDYAFLEKTSQSKNEELITAFYLDGDLYEITGQKKSLADYNDQTIRVYKIQNQKRVLAATYEELQFLYHSPYSGYVFIN